LDRGNVRVLSSSRHEAKVEQRQSCLEGDERGKQAGQAPIPITERMNQQRVGPGYGFGMSKSLQIF